MNILCIEFFCPQKYEQQNAVSEAAILTTETNLSTCASATYIVMKLDCAAT
jgi:hypothetical protein